MRKSLMAATAIALLFGGAAYAQESSPPPGPDPDGYYNQNDQEGYYDRNGQYHRYSETGGNSSGTYDDGSNPPAYNDTGTSNDADQPPPAYDDDEDGAGPPPPPYYREGYYEDNCRRGNTAAGTIFGAIAGGLIGSAASHGDGGAVVGGAILGGLLGNTVARDIPCEDHRYAFRAYSDGLDGQIGRRYDWRHGDNYGYFIPEREFRRNGYRCRSWSETTYVRGRSFTRAGTACRLRDGRWHFDD
jgi:surface antigen